MKKTVREWLNETGITIIETDVEGFTDDKLVDEYEFWITVGYHSTAMKRKGGLSIREIAAEKLKEYMELATEEEQKEILARGIAYVPIKAITNG